MCGVLCGVLLCLPSFPKCHGFISHHIQSPWLIQCSCQGICLWCCGHEANSERKMCYLFLSFASYLRIPLPGRGTAELAISQFSSCYGEFCNMTSPSIIIRIGEITEKVKEKLYIGMQKEAAMCLHGREAGQCAGLLEECCWQVEWILLPAWRWEGHTGVLGPSTREMWHCLTWRAEGSGDPPQCA